MKPSPWQAESAHERRTKWRQRAAQQLRRSIPEASTPGRPQRGPALSSDRPFPRRRAARGSVHWRRPPGEKGRTRTRPMPLKRPSTEGSTRREVSSPPMRRNAVATRLPLAKTAVTWDSESGLPSRFIVSGHSSDREMTRTSWDGMGRSHADSSWNAYPCVACGILLLDHPCRRSNDHGKGVGSS